MSATKARFHIGQQILHKRFNYHGIVIGVDLQFNSSEEWYELVATSRPPKDRPWYHILAHDGRRTYVAERHLDPDPHINN
ncbi:MAG: heat shock protein HspQ [Candidatus Nitrohelix vancouverensis]|uniref:Heat shock protein HspQ n=1 Tax=Candidatus Nitrohelix vancouverensis TaxID=2705534 RepID=A0A7T0BZZ9_9BACT|nr:MAG: heat shock protein HspQ [Candidatus Nitrohelix vancouverensis]